MATKKITDLTQLTDLDATDSFVVNDSGAGADKRVEFSDLQSEVLNGAAIGTSTAITELQVDNLNLNGNTFSSTDTNGNVIIQPNGTGSTIINEAGAGSDFRVEGLTDTDLLFVDASADRVGISTNAPGSTLDVAGTLAVSGDANFDSGTLFVDESTDRVGIGTTTPEEPLDIVGDRILLGSTRADNTTKTAAITIPNRDNENNDLFLIGGLSIGSANGVYIGGSGEGNLGTGVATTDIIFYTGTGGNTADGTERFKIGNTESVFNDTSNDIDFRVEGLSDTHLIFADAGNDRVGIGTSSPSELLHVDGNILVNDKIYFNPVGIHFVSRSPNNLGTDPAITIEFDLIPDNIGYPIVLELYFAGSNAQGGTPGTAKVVYSFVYAVDGSSVPTITSINEMSEMVTGNVTGVTCADSGTGQGVTITFTGGSGQRNACQGIMTAGTTSLVINSISWS